MFLLKGSQTFGIAENSWMVVEVIKRFNTVTLDVTLLELETEV